MSDTAVVENEVEETDVEDYENENADTEQVNLRVVSTGKIVRPHEITAPAMVFGDALALLTEQAPSGVRNAIAKELTAVYSGTFEDDDTEITITPTQKNSGPLLDSLRTLGFQFEIEELPVAEKAARQTKTKEPTFCDFSGEPTKGGHFRAGYDMKMRGALLRIIDQAEDDTTAYVVGLGTKRQNVTRPQAVALLTQTYGWYTEEQINERVAKAQARLAKANEVETAPAEPVADAA